jgi:hypothetical protein
MNWWKLNPYQPEMDLAGHFSGTPRPSAWAKWLGGAGVPFLCAMYAAGCFLTQRAGWGSLDLSGGRAVACGLAWLGVGLFLHFHYFWAALDRLWPYATVGKILSLLLFIGALGYVVCSVAWR